MKEGKKMKVLVTGIRPYMFTDEKSGQVLDGISVQILDLQRIEENGFSGLEWNKLSAPSSLKTQLKDVPGFYDVETKITAGKAKIRGMEFLGKCDIQKALIAK